jgi:hypothetical protein
MQGHFDNGDMPEPPEWAEPVPAGAPLVLKQVDRPKKEKAKPDLEPKSGSAIEHFREKCREAGIVDDKPLFQVLMTIFVAAETALATVQAGARGLTQEGEADLIRRITRHADVSMRDAATKHRLRLERKSSVIAGGIFAACIAIGGGGGYWYGWSTGRSSVETTERQLATAFQAGPDAADVWLRLMKHNDPRRALDHCTGSAVWSDNGRQACSIPLWIDGPGSPEANRK